ncbi:hypothetical protein ABK040_012646 [Willaertia magna]
MSSEQEKLKQQTKQQLDRLLKQLQDVEDCKEELDSEEEYLEIKKETLSQLEEFQKTLEHLNKSLKIDEIRSYQLAIKAACSEAFKTPQVIKLFAEKDVNQIKIKLEQLEVEKTHIGQEIYNFKKSELLSALRKLNPSMLSEDDLRFLNQNMTNQMKGLFDNSSTTTTNNTNNNNDDFDSSINVQQSVHHLLQKKK